MSERVGTDGRPRASFGWGAMFRGLCPECREGRIFASRWRMNENCPVCGLKFERGPGYFTGAMYFSYAIGIPVIALEMLVAKYLIVPKWPLHWILAAAWVAFLPLTPLVFRASRVMFLHMDRYFDPDPDADPASEREG